MKTKFFLFSMFCLNLAYAGVAGSANNDPLIFYAIVLLILGALIGTPYLIKFIKNKMKKSEQINGENDLEKPVE